MRVLITGACGQLGRELQETAPSGWQVGACGRDTLDIRDAGVVHAALQSAAPDLVINTAGYTDVDGAEREKAQAFAVNRDGAAHVAWAAARHGVRLIHISTDFVFSGNQGHPYRPDAAAEPGCVYGASKLEGEQQVMDACRGNVLILRTAWLYSVYGHNFVKTMLRLMAERDEVRVVADQIGTPTWARGLARALWVAARQPSLSGIHHWTDAGIASWYDFAVAVQEDARALGLARSTADIVPIPSEDCPTPARRPSYSVLDKTSCWRMLGYEASHWRCTLREMLAALAEDTA